MIPEQSGNPEGNNQAPEGMQHFYNQSVKDTGDEGAEADIETDGSGDQDFDAGDGDQGQSHGKTETGNVADESQATIKALQDRINSLEKNLGKKTETAEGDDDPGRESKEDEFQPLTNEELDLLYEEDPKAAREYERTMHQRELDGMKKSLGEIQEERNRNAEMASIASFEKDFDAREGQGSFQTIQAQITDPAYLEKLFTENPDIRTMIKPMIDKQDRIGVSRILFREASIFNRGLASRRQARSVSPSTGGNVSTKSTPRIESIADAFAAAKAELT
jgi:hypothetical protein